MTVWIEQTIQTITVDMTHERLRAPSFRLPSVWTECMSPAEGPLLEDIGLLPDVYDVSLRTDADVKYRSRL